jgi:arginyl-tRNA synthetase
MSHPLAQLRDECKQLIHLAASRAYPNLDMPQPTFTRPPNPEMGELSTPICFQLAETVKDRPTAIARNFAEHIDGKSMELVESVEAVNGYVNFRANVGRYAELVLENAVEEDNGYGFMKTNKPKRMMVEHTSANPNGPIHVGNARNSILGDAIANMLKSRGHTTEVHFLVNDMGRQVAMATWGWRLLGKPEPEARSDIWVGTIYASVNVLKEIRRLKAELGEAKASGDPEMLSGINSELSQYVAAAHDLRERNPAIFDALTERIEATADPEAEIVRLNTEYEEEQPGTKEDVRSLVGHCLRGFEQTLGEIGIHFDKWDFESDLVWRKAADEVLDGLKATPYTSYDRGAIVLDCDRVAEDLELKERWGLNPDHEIPHLVLVRSDGTTLYTLRDVAYSIWKFGRVDQVVNVIGFEQTLAQLQLRVALAALGKMNIADRQTHFAYEFVRLPDMRMSGRLGRYVTLVDVLSRAVTLAHDEVNKRSPDLPEAQRREIARVVGHGAVKYALLSVDPMKVVLFEWDKALNFETNSAPFIQYSHARACNIIKRAYEHPEADYAMLGDARERELLMMVAQLPEVFENAVKELKPADISSYANNLADRFNSFYAALPVLKADSAGLVGARLMLVDGVRITLRNALSLLGIEAPERM